MLEHRSWADGLWMAVGMLLLLLYLAGVLAGRRRGRGWPAARTIAWSGGVLCCLAATAGPLARIGQTSFSAHMAGHLLLGMLAPLLLVLGAPVTVALRGLPVQHARRLSRVLARPELAVLTHPVTAALLDVGGLWLLYGTPLFGWMHASPAGHLVAQIHVLVAGYLFTFSLVGVDPTGHRADIRLRSAVLVAALAAHGILAKRLYVDPPAGVSVADGERAAMVMFYGGDLVEIVLVVAVCLEWYRRTAPRSVGTSAGEGHGPAVVRLGQIPSRASDPGRQTE
ncbi:MAG: putative rane protein [Propionibacteriaceae bacterium]|jgi:putative membrane protein|nr:putative rane protein [Propionibacteriaceae bacterium]